MVEVTFTHKDNGLDFITKFAKALETFGIHVGDTTQDGDDNVSITLSREEPPLKWNL